MSLLAVLNDQYPWYGIISLTTCVLGSASITFAFWPGFYNTWKTKDTRFLPIGLFALFLLVGVLMTAGSIAGACVPTLKQWMYVRSGFFIYLNAFVMLVNAYTVGLTLWNKHKKNQPVVNKSKPQQTQPKTQTVKPNNIPQAQPNQQ